MCFCSPDKVGWSGGVSKYAHRVALTLVLTPQLFQIALAEVPSTATPPSDPGAASFPDASGSSSTLPPVVVSAPPKSHLRNARVATPRPKRTATAVRTANVPAQVVVMGGSGAPNVGVGPVGPPNMASQMTFTGEELNARPFTRPGEVLEAAPGLIVTQHSGEGKANQYFLRGYNLDHGTDLAITVDDMPINMRTHAHGQGYADLNWLMPETINALEIRKGPYFADEGDFGSAGNLHIGLIDSISKNIAAGDHRQLRLSSATSAWARPRSATEPAHCRRGRHLQRPVGQSRRHAQAQRPDALQPGHCDGRLLDHRHGLFEQMEFHRPGAAARDHVGTDRTVIGAEDPTDGGNTNRFSLSARMARSRRRRIVEGQRLRHQERARSLQQLHLLPGQSRAQATSFTSTTTASWPAATRREPSMGRSRACRWKPRSASRRDMTRSISALTDTYPAQPSCQTSAATRSAKAASASTPRTRCTGPTGCGPRSAGAATTIDAKVNSIFDANNSGHRQRGHRQPEIHRWWSGRSTRRSFSSAPAGHAQQRCARRDDHRRPDRSRPTKLSRFAAAGAHARRGGRRAHQGHPGSRYIDQPVPARPGIRNRFQR